MIFVLKGVKTISWTEKKDRLHFIALMLNGKMSLFQIKQTQLYFSEKICDLSFEVKTAKPKSFLDTNTNEEEENEQVDMNFFDLMPIKSQSETEYESLIISTSKDRKKIFLFKLSIDTVNKKFTNKFIHKEEMPKDRVVTTLCHVADLLKLPSPYQIVIGDNKGEIHFYSVQVNFSGKVDFKKKGFFRAHEETEGEIEFLKPAYFGRIATSAKNSKVIKIWELESSIPFFKLESVIECNSSTPIFDWLPIPDGNFVMAVGDNNMIRLFSEAEPQKMTSFSPNWQETETFSIGKSVNRSMNWCKKSGTLVVGSNREVFVFTKWRNKEKNLNHSTFYHKACSLHHPLPLYHPKVLMEDMMSADFLKLEKVLRHLLDSLESYPNIDEMTEVLFIPPMEQSDFVEKLEDEQKKGKKKE